MTAGIYNLVIEQGVTWVEVFTKKTAGMVEDLTGFTARSQGRSQQSSNVTTFDLTTENGGIVLGGVLGTITLTMSDAVTSALAGDGVWDLELIDGSGNVSRLLKGEYKVDLEVTR